VTREELVTAVEVRLQFLERTYEREQAKVSERFGPAIATMTHLLVCIEQAADEDLHRWVPTVEQIRQVKA